MSYDNFNYLTNNPGEKDGGELLNLRATDMKSAKKTFSRLGVGFGVFISIYFLSSILLVYVANIVAPGFLYRVELKHMISIFSIYGLSLPVLLLLLQSTKGKVPEKKKMNLKQFAICLVICFGIMYIGAIIGNTVSAYVSKMIGREVSNALADMLDIKTIFLTSMYTVILAPIGEEFIFRKLIVDRTAKFGVLPSMIVSGLLLGLMHGNFYQFFYVSMLGCVLAYLYYNTGNIYICMAIHAIVNFVGSFVPLFLTTDFGNMVISVFQFIGLMIMEQGVFAAIISSIILLIVLRKKLIKNSNPSDIDLYGTKVLSAVFANPGMIICLVIHIVFFSMTYIKF